MALTIMTFSIVINKMRHSGITVLSIMTLTITALRIITLTITPLSIRTLGITINKMRHSSIIAEHCYAECHK
jgi:hypothetical protein